MCSIAKLTFILLNVVTISLILFLWLDINYFPYIFFDLFTFFLNKSL